MVHVVSASATEIVDEARLGRARDSATFEGILAITDRKIGNLVLREISPYLLSLGPLQEEPEWKALNVFAQSLPFAARLADTETIKVPAGTFEARKLIIEGQQDRRLTHPVLGVNPYTITLWYAPAVKRLIKAKFDGPTDKEVIELVEYRLQ